MKRTVLSILSVILGAGIYTSGAREGKTVLGSCLSESSDSLNLAVMSVAEEALPNGGVRRLQRHGLKADGMYGKVDNLHITYEGNRIRTVLDDALPVTQPGSMDFPVSGREMSLRYNEWGGGSSVTEAAA